MVVLKSTWTKVVGVHHTQGTSRLSGYGTGIVMCLSILMPCRDTIVVLCDRS